jgi:hypothetical protein
LSRPKPQIIVEWTDPKTYKTEQVLAADAIYAVFYEGRPINLRTLNSLFDYPGPKYRKVSFSNEGHCHNLAQKLNKRFKTGAFQVYKLVVGEVVVEGED